MKRFLINLIIFIAINVAAATAYLYVTQNWYAQQNWTTWSNLLIMPSNAAYDLVFLGSSHGRIFTSTTNHRRVEKILGKTMLNLSKTAAGIMPEKAFLEDFYARGNKAPLVVYFFDPAIMYSAKWNEMNYFLEDEPLNMKFLTTVVRGGFDSKVIINYVRSKFSFYWFTSRKPVYESPEERSLALINLEAVKKRRDFLYSDGTDAAIFRHYAQDVRTLVELANSHGSRLIFILPATLLGDLPGSVEMKQLFADLKKEFKVDFFDFSNAIKEPKWYSDHDHLNTAGVELFTGKYLKPAIDRSMAPVGR